MDSSLSFRSEYWDGTRLVAMFIVPQVFVVYYSLWMLVRRWMKIDDRRSVFLASLIGTALGTTCFILGPLIHVLIPWMFLIRPLGRVL